MIFTSIFLFLLFAGYLVQAYLSHRQVQHVTMHRAQVPADFASVISLAAHQKAADYTRAKERLGMLEAALGIAVLLGWTLLGGLNALNQWTQNLLPNSPLSQQLLLLAGFSLIGGVIDLPFSYYRTFVLEQKFGFNKSTLGLWLGDMLKGAVLAAVIGLPLAALVLWLMQAAGSLWWFYAWAVLALFQVLMLWIYPTYIAPLFNQFKPLDDVDLKDRIEQLMARSGFTAKGLFVVDGSRRSAHANAYFTGFGSSKRVVFYDTLLAKLSGDEMEAVLAHELGHFKHRHVMKRLVAMFVISLLGFALLGWLMGQTWFYTDLGVEPSLTGANNALALLLFMLVSPVFMFFVSPLVAQVSRKQEFEADAYAIKQARASDLKQALLKLYEDNASTLTPDPSYVRFYYSHPPAHERLRRMGVLAS